MKIIVIMKSYGIPEKMMRTIMEIFQDLKCAVVDEREWFKIRVDVKEGCILSGFLFLLVLGWIIRRTAEDEVTIRCWNFSTFLENLDFYE